MKATPELILKAWNKMSEDNYNNFPKVKILTGNRRKNCLRLIKDMPEMQDWENAISMVPKDYFRNGQNARMWVADFDWLIRATKDNHVKLLEEYINKQEAEEVLSSGFGK